MYQAIPLMDRIKSKYSSLRPSEQKVAHYILDHWEGCAQMTISDLAEAVGVSQPTIIRFVQALGIDGYRNFKYCLVRENATEQTEKNYFSPMAHFDLNPWETLEQLPLKETTFARELLEEALKSLSVQELSQAVKLIASAKTIDIYGVENSFTPANDLLTKLTYLGLNSKMHTDTYLQQISAAHLTKDDVAIAISHSGRSKDTVKAIKQAKKAGAKTIVITSAKTAVITKYADVCLCTGSENSVIYGSAIFSRVPDIALVDLLYMGIILSDYEKFSKNLDKSGSVIADRGYEETPS